MWLRSVVDVMVMPADHLLMDSRQLDEVHRLGLSYPQAMTSVGTAGITPVVCDVVDVERIGSAWCLNVGPCLVKTVPDGIKRLTISRNSQLG